MATQYDTIHFNQSRLAGQVRMSESGLGWKASEQPQGGSAAKVSEPFLLPSKEVVGAHWSRGARNYMLRIQTKTNGVVQLDGFDADDFTSLKNALSQNLGVNLEQREHSVRGWNWGEADFERNELVFTVASRPSFEIPYSSVVSSNTVGKSEVAVEMNLQAASERTNAGDELVEIRFYVPGTVVTEGSTEEGDGETKPKVETEGGDGEGEGEEEEVELNAAELFHEQLQKNADIEMVTGAELVAFAEILFLTPRGRYDMDMFEDSFRLRGKSYDYKVPYASIQRIFVLPKPDEINNLVILQLEPPLRQGQTRYPFLVMQFLREEELEVELNVEDEEFEKKYAGRLQKTYEESSFQLIANLFKGLSGRKITFTGSYVSSRNHPSVSSSLRAAEGSLFILEKAFLFVSKSPVYIPYTEVTSVRFARVDAAVVTSRTFDMAVSIRAGTDYQFSNINKEEQATIESYLKSKNIKTKNDADEEKQLLKAALAESGSDAEMAVDDGDEESDEDFADEDEDSDVALEFDADANSSASESEGDYSGSGSDDPPKPPSKRAKH